MPKKRYSLQRVSAWFRLLLVMVGALVLLAACGNTNTPSTDTATPAPTIAQTPTPDVSNTTPTPTVSPSTPTSVPGSTQLLMIITSSNGSFGFSPTTLTIKVGATVTWKNVSGVAHTVTSDDGQTFDSGTIAADGTFHFTFKAAGTFAYHCNYHPYMRATIVVV